MTTIYLSLFLPFFLNRNSCRGRTRDHLFHIVSCKIQEFDTRICLKAQGKVISLAFKSSALPVPRAAPHSLQSPLHPSMLDGQNRSPRTQTLCTHSLAFPIQARKNMKHSKGGNKTKRFHLFISTKSPSHLKVKIHQKINKNQFQIKDALLLLTPSRLSKEVLLQLQGVTLSASQTQSTESSFEMEKKIRVRLSLQVMVRRKLFPTVDHCQVLPQ